MPPSLRRALGAAAAVLCLLAAGAATTPSPARAAAAPAGMFGLGDWAWPTAATLDREAQHGLRTWRVSLSYRAVGGTQGTLNFSGVDGLVARAAQRGVTPMFVISGCPAWSCPTGAPPTSGQQLSDWKAFVTAAVRRYGTGGSFWASHPTLPARPATEWQVWNEVNGSAAWPDPDPSAYAPLLAATAASIRAADPAARVVLAGLPQKMTIWMKDYLAGLYRQPGFKASVDVVAIHAYAPLATDVPAIADVARKIMLANGDGAKPLWITEMGWATGGPAHPFVTTEAGQAANLRQSWDALVACRARWGLERVYWFGWQDRDPGTTTDYWGYHKGYLRLDGTAKPSLAASDEFFGAAPLPDGRAATCALPGGTTLDWTVPETSITAGPTYTADTTPPFRFSSNETGVTYQCRLDGAGWSTCTPGIDGTWSPSRALAGGSHTLYVRASDLWNNVDASPASRTFTVDTQPPDTYVSGTWGAVSTSTVSLALSANEPVSRYECRVDAGAWATCTSPYTTTLTPGSHHISVRAYDRAGLADPSPAVPWYTVAG